jgi:hypothetical protein
MNKLSLVLLLALCACESTTVPTDEELLVALRQTAARFANAMEAQDFAAATATAAPSARGYFAAEQEFYGLLLEREVRDPSRVMVRGAERDGDQGVVEVAIAGERGEQTLFLQLELDDFAWGVSGFARERGGDVRRFADLEAEARQRLASAVAETTPHPELGPIVTAYVAASKLQDLGGMTANMTDAGKQQQQASRSAFTPLFVSGEIAIQKWQFSGHEVADDRATQRIRTILTRKDGSTDGEPLTFEFVKKSGTWKIDAIR